MYREWGPKNKPLWNPLQNAGKIDSVERKLRGLDEFCHVNSLYQNISINMSTSDSITISIHEST